MSDPETDSIGGRSVISLSPTRSPSPTRIAQMYGVDTEEDTDTQSPNTTLSSRPVRHPRSNVLNSSRDAEHFFLSRVFKRGTKNNSRDWLELYLNNFHVHAIDEPTKPVSLHIVASHDNKKSIRYAFTGTASHEDGSHHDVGTLEILSVQVGNFGGFDKNDRPTTSSCRKTIYLQTKNSMKNNCYYVLQVPNKEYAGAFMAFQWLATMAKHVNDYLEWKASNNQSTHLDDFSESFSEKLNEWHGNDSDFHEWTQQSGGISDFRRHLTCSRHAEFIYDQIYNVNVDDDDSVLSQPIWTKVAPQCLRDTFNYDEINNRPTFVTSFVQKSFLGAFPKWKRRQERREDLLMVSEIVPEVLEWRDERSARLGLGRKSSYKQAKNFERNDNHDVSIAALLLEKASLQARKPSLGVSADKLLGKAVVVRTETADYRYAYVHGLSNGGRGLKVRWLLLPNQTVCEGRTAGSVRARPPTFYPIGNELFFSDECCCDVVPVYRVVAVHGISTVQDHSSPEHELFVHRRYVSEDFAISETSEEDIGYCHRHDPKISNKQAGFKRTNKSPFVLDTTVGHILSLFSGSGILDSGFERGAEHLFETIFAADCDLAAVTSFEANHKNRNRCEFHNEDVNILYQEFCNGTRSLPNIRILIAGCPCQGFSLLNSKRHTDKARKNCSMAAQTIAWVDLLRPEMVLIENVKTMDPLGTTSGASAAGQCISTLVAMGYQARIAMIRASDYGGPTSRERLFIIATAPGIPLPALPPPSHGTGREQSPIVTASAATIDLPEIDNCTTINPLHPDHVPHLYLRPLEHSVISKIPTVQSVSHNNLSTVASKLDLPEEIEWYEKHNSEQRGKSSGSWCRVYPNKPMGTIVTSVNPKCARSGKSLHWHQHRICSLQEYRRFHGVPDDYILVGSRDQQMHQLGNSVAWATSNVLGKAFADA